MPFKDGYKRFKAYKNNQGKIIRGLLNNALFGKTT